jgi:hypothetical protein
MGAEQSALHDALERHEDSQRALDVFRGTIEDLLATTIDVGGQATERQKCSGPPPEAGCPKHASSQSRYELRRPLMRALRACYDGGGRVPALPDWALEEAQRYVSALGGSVVLEANPDDPRCPNVRVEFDPAALVNEQRPTDENVSTGIPIGWKSAVMVELPWHSVEGSLMGSVRGRGEITHTRDMTIVSRHAITSPRWGCLTSRHLRE